nr:AAA family ATPase [Deltaproteobacteria bacterium]
MHLHKITLHNFKNYPEAEFTFSGKINCFVGNNGVGKTNLLDAVYYLSFCKS